MTDLTLHDVQLAVAFADSPRRVSIGADPSHGSAPDNTALLWRRADGSWFVAWSERGSLLDAQTFATEAEACAAFLRLVGLEPPFADAQGTAGSARPAEGRRTHVDDNRVVTTILGSHESISYAEPREITIEKVVRGVRQREYAVAAYRSMSDVTAWLVVTARTSRRWRVRTDRESEAVAWVIDGPEAVSDQGYLLPAGGAILCYVTMGDLAAQRERFEKALAGGLYTGEAVVQVRPPKMSWEWRIWSWAMLVLAGLAAVLGALSESSGSQRRGFVVATLLAAVVAVGWLVRASSTERHVVTGVRSPVQNAQVEVERAMETLSRAPSLLTSYGAPDEVAARAQELLTSAEGPVRLLEEGRGMRADRDHLRQLEAEATALINQWGHR